MGVNLAPRVDLALPIPAGHWQQLLDSADPRWFGPGRCVAATLGSPGDLRLPLPRFAFVVLEQK